MSPKLLLADIRSQFVPVPSELIYILVYHFFPFFSSVIQNSVRQNTQLGSIQKNVNVKILVSCAALLNSMKQHFKTKNNGWQDWRRMWQRAEVWLLLVTRWMTGASLTCRQAPRCLLVSHYHLYQQTMSCVQPSALIYINYHCTLLTGEQVV